jgi:hypothetical protein
MHQHEDETDHKHEGHSASNTHMLIMILCCIIPLVAVASFLAIFPENPYLLFSAFLLCPVFMVLMMLPDWLHRKRETAEKHLHPNQ